MSGPMISASDLPRLLERLRAPRPVPVCLMEVCGTHTMSIARSGIRQLLPKDVRLISGPGCPVCVTPAGAIDGILALSQQKDVLIATYGDLVRVPGSRPGDTLAIRRARGARVRVVFSPMDALELAAADPHTQVVFLGVGFETTAPGTALAVREACRRGIGNFSVFSLLRRVEPALRSLAESPDFAVDGLLCPGHVAVILGEDGFRFLPEELRLPAVISGFEPEDILLSAALLLEQIRSGQPRLQNTYRRAVRPHGNEAALRIMDAVLEPADVLWRGLGLIPRSGLAIRPEYAAADAAKRFGLDQNLAGGPSACRCGEVIRGVLAPEGCPLFGRACVPEDPVGPCMVSGEGACAAAWNYRDL